jgi:D-glycero-alpha-D-manno-heptose-7-phosphate kinase
MLITKSPFRISLFGGSTDYKDFYERSESFIIGTTIDKYVYMSTRRKPSIFSSKSILTYSTHEEVGTVSEIKNPLIREVLKFYNISFPIEFTSFTDIPSRTGLGGSSTFCAGLCYSIRTLLDLPISKKVIASDSIHIERNILNESGGIQDQIWASYGGTNTIQIDRNGNFYVKPLPITSDFKLELENSMLLIYSDEQRISDGIAKSHENKNKNNILSISKEAYNEFLNENIDKIGNLLYKSWKEKESISPIISTDNINNIIDTCMNLGAYGAKLLGSGGCGFILVICNSYTKHKIIDTFNDKVLEFRFENSGVSKIL